MCSVWYGKRWFRKVTEGFEKFTGYSGSPTDGGGENRRKGQERRRECKECERFEGRRSSGNVDKRKTLQEEGP